MLDTRAIDAQLVSTYVDANPNSRLAYERASRLFPGGVTHDARSFLPFLPYIARAQGAHKWDLDGHLYVDYAMGHGALLLGHAHPATVEAVTRQAALGTHPGANHLLEIEWAERVHALVPGAQLVRFTSSGTEATLLAIRLARAATAKTKIVKFQGHFHGWHDAVNPGQTPPFNDVSPGILPAAAAETIVLPTDPEAVRSILSCDRDIAAVIVEPSGASAGAVPLPDGFLATLRGLTIAHGVCLIFDEVITGFRWAPGGAQQAYGIQADLVTLAKILAGGLPGGAVTGRRNILEALGAATSTGRRIRHPGTFNGNPLSAAAGIACLDVIADGTTHAHCDTLTARLIADMNVCLTRHGVCGAAYGEASGFHLAFDPRLSPGDPASLAKLPVEALKQQRQTTHGAALTLAMLLRGVHLMGLGGFVSIAHTPQDVARTVAALDAALVQIAPLLPTAPQIPSPTSTSRRRRS